jgi:hypothetical protein
MTLFIKVEVRRERSPSRDRARMRVAVRPNWLNPVQT